MNYILLYAGEQSELSTVVVWTVLVLAVVLLAGLVYMQLRGTHQLRDELSQLDQVKKTNVEYDFVLRTMRLSTWHINANTREIVWDSDYRDKSDTFVPSMGKDLVAAMPEHDRLRVAKTIDDLCSGRIEEAREEYQIMVRDSHKMYWSESYAAVAERDADGRPTRIVGTSKRIDERKTLEEELVKARNRAEESDRLKSAFIANMSHEIRTPLNAIVGFASVLSDVQDAAERQTLLDLINENTQKLLRIIDDVVNISKIEAGKEELVLSCFNLNELMLEVVEKNRQKLLVGVEMNTMFALEQLNVTTDMNRLRESLNHLVSNAVKFTSKGRVVAGYDAPKNGRVRMWVSDTGKGVAQENLERIFERFFKVDEFIPGAGLGLSICRTMAYSLGGKVGCESKLGKGSTFWFEIPFEGKQ